MRLIILTGLGVTRPTDYQALKNHLMAHFASPPSELVSANPQQVDPLVNRLAEEFGIPVKRFPIAPDHTGGEAKNTCGGMAVYASEVPGSAAVVVASVPSELALHLRAVCGTYEVPCHLVQVPLTEYDKPVDAVAKARDITPLVQVVAPAPEPYIFPQSHSSLNVFETCPRQYEAKYITKESPYVQSPEAKWGDDVHQALETYLKCGGSQALPANMSMYQRFGDWVLRRAEAGGAKLLAERNLAVDKNLAPVSYRDRTRWMGGKIDVSLIYPGGLAEVLDWKTGKMKNDQTQLQMYGALTLSGHPEVQTVGTGYVWLADGVISPPVFYQRGDLAQHWDTFQHKYLRLKQAYVNGVFPPRPNGLCRKWCDVKSCEFHGKGGR
jgi:hypothetical protein